MAEYKGFAANVKDWLKPGGQTRILFPPGYEELEASLAAFRQEMSRTTAAQQAKNKGWTSRLINSLTPGEREINAARQAYAAYWDSAKVSTLDAAINHFHKAGARRQREARALAFGFFLDALDRYESCGHKQDDLERTIRTGNDAQNLWSDGTNPGVHGIVLYDLAATHYHLYDRSTANEGSSGSDIGAYELAMKYFLEVMNNKHVGDLRLLSRVQLGVLIMTRCTHENTTAGLETCIEHWERALKEMNSPKKDTARTVPMKENESADNKLLTAERVIRRAAITYQLGVAYQLQYREDLDSDNRLHNLSTTIDYFESAKCLFEEMEHPAFSSPSMFVLATRLVLRWELTKEQSDLDRAKELLRTAQTIGNADEDLKQKIAGVLTAIESPVDSQ